MPGPGIHPVFAVERSWFIDCYRKEPLLRVARTQIPLAPALACTAHAAQGTSLDCVIVGFMLGRGVSSIASYVAITRVKQREGLIIY